MNENQIKMKNAVKFAEENIVELSRLIYEWKHTGMLNRGENCILHDLAEMLPDMSSKLSQAEVIVSDICLRIVSEMEQIKL